MTEPKAHQVDLSAIRPGDDLIFRMTVSDPSSTCDERAIAVHLCGGGGQSGWYIPTDAIIEHVPAPRPLVPGPAIWSNGPREVVIIALHGSDAWVKWNGMNVIAPQDQLRNTEGAAS
jgi:hypothetical protein